VSDPKRDYEAGLDGLQADMAEHQRRYVGEVTASKNQSLAREAIERIERQDRESAATAPEARPQAPLVTSERREVDGRTYIMDREPDRTPMFRSASEFEQQVLQRAEPRIQRLMSEDDSGPLGSPSWRARTLAAMYFKVKSIEHRRAGHLDLAEYCERAFQLDLENLLEQSNASFGDWRKDAPSRITIT
jgi:hypothetical protein